MRTGLCFCSFKSRGAGEAGKMRFFPDRRRRPPGGVGLAYLCDCVTMKCYDGNVPSDPRTVGS